MKLYTLQPIEFWESLKRHGSIAADPKIVEKGLLKWDESRYCWGFKRSYEWLIGYMRKLIPSRLQYPIWAWTNKPDLRRERHYYNFPNGGARICFEKSESEMLLSDFESWHYVLNYWYLSETEKESDDFGQECKDKTGFGYFERKPLPDPQLDQRLRSSWEAIFEPDKCEKWFGGSPRLVQATVWGISMDSVLEVSPFKTPGKKR